VPLGETFPSWNPTKALDHFFVSEDVTVLDASVPDLKLSDHMPIMMDMQVEDG
jgi:endonuclease/exonuclease/phosphatase family metal-dependent hydrolase